MATPRELLRELRKAIAQAKDENSRYRKLAAARAGQPNDESISDYELTRDLGGVSGTHYHEVLGKANCAYVLARYLAERDGAPELLHILEGQDNS